MSGSSGLSGDLTQLYGVIQGQVSQRASTQQVWQAVRDELTTRGYTLPGNAFQQVNQLRSYAVQQRNSAEAFSKAAPDSVITSQMISQTFYSQSLAWQAANPQYHIRYTANVTVNGEQIAQQLTYSLPNVGDQTVQTLLNMLQVRSEALLANPENYANLANGFTLDSIDGVQISSVGVGA